MKKKTTLTIVSLIIVLAGVGGFFALSGSKDDSEVQVSTQATTDTMQTTREITTAMISAGLKSKQLEFESKEPIYPDLGGDKITYTINIDGTTTPELHPADAQLWDVVETLAPDNNIFKSISTFEVYFDEEDTTLASVVAEDDTNSKWLYSINYTAVTEFDELAPTIVHEFAHILGLQDSQTTTEAEIANIRTSCQNLLIAEGCLNDGSFLGEYFDRFWKDNEAFQGDKDRSENETESFFADRKNDYVSAYSTTNTVEDFAESFMFYAVKDTLDVGTTKAQKTDFFNQFATLKEYRANVRSSISNWK